MGVVDVDVGVAELRRGIEGSADLDGGILGRVGGVGFD